jgi:hypothetical protein
MAIKQIPFSVTANIENFLAGIAIEESRNSSDKQKAAKKIDSYLNGIETDLREVYDKYIPNVLVASPTAITNLIVNRMQEDPLQFLDPSGAKNIVEKFADTNGEYYRRLHTRINRALLVYHTKLLKQQGGMTNPIAELNRLSMRLFNRARKIDNAVSARVLGMEFANSIKQVFGSKAILAAIEPGLGEGYVFFSSSFTAIGDAIRNNLYNHIESVLRSIIGPLEFSSKYKTGSIVNIGHAALVNDIGQYVNSPAFAKAMYSISTGGSKLYAPEQLSQGASFFKKESRIIENKITVDREFTGPEKGYAALLTLGITFTNFEDAAINQDRGRRYERTALTKIGTPKKVKLTTSQRRNLFDTLFKRVLKGSPHLAQGSRSILEYIDEVIIAALTGKKARREKSKKTYSSKTTRTDFVPKTNTKATKFKKPAYPKQVANLQKNTTEFDIQDEGLLSLQNLLNAKLVERVKQNMGTGGRRDILNLRSGRFAESVQVERLSASKAGAITAFYTYMRNPYSTFSSGGAQQYPRSRDPKLLISKSIRELAQTITQQRLRAVLV